MKIKNIELKNNLILAPMAGVSDVAFRSICVALGADYAVCEMVSAKALVHNSKKTIDLLHTADNEKIKVCQLFGSDAVIMAKACTHPALQKFDIIDINMGCPAPKIVKNNEGSALMKTTALAEDIIKACVAATDKPVTVKFRSGWDESTVNAVEFACMCERSGASAITVHARTKSQMYSGVANLDIIKTVVNAVKIPVIGNGDVTDKKTYEHMLKYTGCAAVMVGRGAMGSPQIFSEILGKKCTKTPLGFIKEHISILQKFYPDNFIVKHMRKHILWYLKNIKNANQLKQKITAEPSLNNVLDILADFFKE